MIGKQSLQDMLDAKDLCGKRFLDIGSGSGLFSLAARELGASVLSFDFDLPMQRPIILVLGIVLALSSVQLRFNFSEKV